MQGDEIMEFTINTDGLSKSDIIVANYIMKNYFSIPYMSINEVAKCVNVSEATLSRFCRKIGYENFKDLKKKIIESSNISPSLKVKNTLIKMSSSSHDKNTINNVLSNLINNLNTTLEILDKKKFENAVSEIINAKKIFIFAPAPSYGLAYILQYRLNRFGFNIVLMKNSGSAIFEDMINIESSDIILVFGFSKMLVETKVLLEFCNKNKYKTILLTDLMESEMSRLADISLCVYRGSINEFHSMTSITALIDCIIVEIALRFGNKAIQKLDKLSSLRKDYSSYIRRA